MRVMSAKAQREAMAQVVMLQHRIIETMPVVLEVLDYTGTQRLFDDMMEHMRALASSIDPKNGMLCMLEAFDRSSDRIMKRLADLEERMKAEEEGGQA